LGEFIETDLAVTICIDLLDDLSDDILVEVLAKRENLSDFVSGD